MECDLLVLEGLSVCTSLFGGFTDLDLFTFTVSAWPLFLFAFGSPILGDFRVWERGRFEKTFLEEVGLTVFAFDVCNLLVLVAFFFAGDLTFSISDFMSK